MAKSHIEEARMVNERIISNAKPKPARKRPRKRKPEENPVAGITTGEKEQQPKW